MPVELLFALQNQKHLTIQESQRAEQESQRAEQESQRAEQESQRANAAELQIKQLRDRLIALGIDPDLSL
jgi:hypothetical protein